MPHIGNRFSGFVDKIVRSPPDPLSLGCHREPDNSSPLPRIHDRAQAWDGGAENGFGKVSLNPAAD